MNTDSEITEKFRAYFQNDDLRRKLDDFERINKAQRTLNEHNQTLENELKKLKMK